MEIIIAGVLLKDFTTELWDGDEYLLKIDHSFENGRRVIGITSNETLEYFSRVDFLYELTFNIVFFVVDFFYG
jgi:hypothetical protein